MVIEPKAIAELVETYVSDEYADARKFDNRALLDESGVWTLHQLAAEIYALGFRDGAFTEETCERGKRQRKADAIRAAKATEVQP
jgi:hypothetical protein